MSKIAEQLRSIQQQLSSPTRPPTPPSSVALHSDGGGRAPSLAPVAGGKVTINRELTTVSQVFSEWMVESSNPYPLHKYYDDHGGWIGWRDVQGGKDGAEKRYWNDTRRPIFTMIASMVDHEVYGGKCRGDVNAFMENVRPPVSPAIELAVTSVHRWQEKICPPATAGQAPLRSFANKYRTMVEEDGGLPNIAALLGHRPSVGGRSSNSGGGARLT